MAAVCALASIGADTRRTIRITGTIEAVHSIEVRVPNIQGQGGNLTLVTLIKNGATVHEGEVLAAFDDTAVIKLTREALAKYDDLTHQVEQKKAEHRSNAEKRTSQLQQAQADLKKAELEIRKGPILSDIDQEKNRVKLEDAKAQTASLERSNVFHDQAEEAEIRILELQRDRQKITVERERSNAAQLTVKAPMEGMVALKNVWRNGSFGHAQEGDQLWPGSPVLELFNPATMVVDASIAEPDTAKLKPGGYATVRLDAFPELVFPAHFQSANPVAAGALGSPIKSFAARFILEKSDPHLLPDLSAAVDVEARP